MFQEPRPLHAGSPWGEASLRVSERRRFGFYSWESAQREFGTGSASPLLHMFVREAQEQRW